MGFDDGECYFCYAIGGGNEKCKDKRYDICFECLSKRIEVKGSSVTARWMYGLSNSIKEYTNYMNKDNQCYICQETKILTVNLSICEDCIK
jgi:hypothetical protein